MTEAEAVAAAQAGEPTGFDFLYRTHQLAVLRFCRRIVRDQADPEELAQNVFLAVQRKIGQFRGHAAFQTWLFAIARNECLMELRRLSRHLPPLSLDTLAASDVRIPRTSPRPADILALEDAVSRLPEDRQRLFDQHFVQGRKLRELAVIHSITEGAMNSRLCRLRNEVRDALE